MAAGQEIRLRLGARIHRPDFLSLRVVNAILGDVQAYIPIDSHVASQLHVVRSGIVLRVIGVNVCVANMNHDVIARRGQAIFICRLAR